MPELPENMSFDEFQILSRDIKLMDMAAAMTLPGYISFKAMEEKAAYLSISIRSVGYAGALYELYRYHDTKGVSIWINDIDRNIIYGTIGVILSSFILDWLYGKTELEKKQEAIRYKYRQELLISNNF